MMKLLTKIWETIVRYRINKFRKAPTIKPSEFDSPPKRYFKVRSKSKVISVGNLSFGGTGKTPFIVTLVDDYLPKNLKIAIVARGYKRQKFKDIVISPENFDLYDIDTFGDEPAMLFHRLQIPIAVSNKKYKALIDLENNIAPDIVVIDDGYQHLWIERDLDLLILDKQTLDCIEKNKFCLLREPLSSISRADALIIPENHHTNLLNNISSPYKIFHFRVSPEKIKKVLNYNPNTNHKFIAISGIANPKRFLNTLYELNIDPLKTYIFPDHHNYSDKQILKIIEKARKWQASIITTEKDLVKLLKFKLLFDHFKVNLFCAIIKFEILEKNEFHDFLTNKLNF